MSKRITFGLIFLLILPQFPIYTSVEPTENNETEYWALLIVGGVYAGDPYSCIQSTLDDTEQLYKILCNSPGWLADHVKIIKGKDATVVNILAGLRWLDKMDDSNDISLVFFNTHGFPLGFDIPPIDEKDGTDEALITYWGINFPSLFIWDDEINVLLNRLDSKGVCLIVDSCYAGGFNDTFSWNTNYQNTMDSIKTKSSQTSSKWMKGFVEDLRGNNRVILMSSHEKETSMEPSFFTASIIDGLRGYADDNMDRIISAEELFFYVKGRVFWQSPSFYDDFVGDLPLIILPEGYFSKKNANNVFLKEKKNPEIPSKYSTFSDATLVCGYITDYITGNPIENARISLSGSDIQGNEYYNITFTNADGFYSINVYTGTLYFIISADYYLWEQTDSYLINENETMWINISLDLYPPRNSIVNGYITDNETGAPIIQNNRITLCWFDGQGHYWENYSFCDENGFYTFSSFAGEVHVEYFGDDYCYYRSCRNDVDGNETLSFNFSLIKNNIRVDITKPLRALYIQNELKLPQSTAKIIGNIEIEANVHRYWHDPIEVEKVEFYIDDNLKTTDTTFPYSWIWDSGDLLHHRYTIRVIAYDVEGNNASDEITVWKFM